jgi:hypothetical protein
VVQAIGHDRVFPVDEGRQPVVLPQQIPDVPCCGLLEHKAQARIVALVLDNGENPDPDS